MLRKKRREKDGHKDPLLVEVSRLQDNIMKDIAELRQEAEEAEKKQSELDKVAQILGINILDKSQKSSSDSREPTEKMGKAEKSKSPEKMSSSSNSSSNSKVITQLFCFSYISYFHRALKKASNQPFSYLPFQPVLTLARVLKHSSDQWYLPSGF